MKSRLESGVLQFARRSEAYIRSSQMSGRAAAVTLSVTFPYGTACSNRVDASPNGPTNPASAVPPQKIGREFRLARVLESA